MGNDTDSQTPEPIVLQGFGAHDLYQRRERIFTRWVDGFYQRLRYLTGWPLLLGYFLTPWLTWGERQAVLFDLPARQFHLFGLTLWPQDLWLLGLALVVSAFALFTVTNLVGRVWCGYTCPQTVWTTLFMWSEQFAEGERHQRIRLDHAPWSLSKLRKRALKHTLWLGCAGLTGLTFVGYFVPIRTLAVEILTMSASPAPFFWTLFFAAATYINAGWMREQVCIYMCPYARFQSAMIDRDTWVVSYDAARGEPRGARKRGGDAGGLGDCIDCQLCVQVCPTGIDIRDGLQYQCIGCAQCIDACTQVMRKMSYPPGLIRYTTERAQQGGKTRWFRPRSAGYAAALAVMSVILVTGLSHVAPLEISAARERGTLWRTEPDGRVKNDYRLRILNKTEDVATFEIMLDAQSTVTSNAPETVDLAAGEIIELPFSLSTRSVTPESSSFSFDIRVCHRPSGRCDTADASFLVPTS
jgi:cytochrome c oxidase accessory protein FixG